MASKSVYSVDERVRRRRLLRTAELNAVGRLALLGLCATGGIVGVAVGGLLGFPSAPAACVAGAVPMVVVVILDRGRWRAMFTGYGWGATAAEVSEVAADLARRGVDAHVQLDDEGRASLRYRHRDRAVVRVVLADRGVPGMPPPR